MQEGLKIFESNILEKRGEGNSTIKVSPVAQTVKNPPAM